MNFKNEIKSNRFYDFTVKFKPAYANKQISIVLKQHKFLFGCNAFGLLRRGFSEKPAYIKLKELINKEWGFQKKTAGKNKALIRYYVLRDKMKNI